MRRFKPVSKENVVNSDFTPVGFKRQQIMLHGDNMGFLDKIKKAGNDLERKTGGAVVMTYKKGVKCPKCKKEYPPGTKFCSQCGEALK